MTDLILLAAGGTGGHLFPAEALAHALKARGFTVDLVTDHRAVGYGGAFPARETHIVASATLAGRSPAAVLRFAGRLVAGLFQSRALISRLKPAVVVGFGGYPTVPPLLAARLAGVPTLVHEANAVMGRANRLLARSASRLATGFARVEHAPGGEKTVMTGNPVRPAVIAAAAIDLPDFERLSLLIFGGSQGARVFADLVPPAVERLAPDLRARLDIVQQARAEDCDRVSATYARLGVAHEVRPFFTDLPARIAAAHLVVARSGAGTCAELTVIGRPSLLVPLPHALDNDQKKNAAELELAGAALLAEQKTLDPATLAGHLAALLTDPARLAAMAAKARALGRPDAVDRLADLVAALVYRKNRTEQP